MNLYLKRYAYGKQFIAEKPARDLRLIIVVPCYNEPELIRSLASLANCELPAGHTEVIVIINEPETCAGKICAQNESSFKAAEEWVKAGVPRGLTYHIHYVKLPHKHAGVGMARKIGMDEAVRRFEAIGKHREGIIVCFDADSLCQKNYLTAIEDHFRQHPDTPGCTIYYEHPLEGAFSARTYQGIIKYELFLRYYVDALRFAGFPYAFQTIGSSMAVRSWAYQKQGGMNRRKAGEDFYFLHKIIPLGGFTELNSTKVIPSPRASDRVPFGTGKAIRAWLDSGTDHYPAYHPQSFIDLKHFLKRTGDFFRAGDTALAGLTGTLPLSIQSFLTGCMFDEKIKEINNNSRNIESFHRRFYQWMNGFRALKYIHHAQEKFYAPIDIEEASRWLWSQSHDRNSEPRTGEDLLTAFRNMDRARPFIPGVSDQLALKAGHISF